MDGGGVNSANIASAVWTATTRTPTGFGLTAESFSDQTNTTLAASGSLDFRPIAGRWREIMIGVLAGSAGTAQLQIWDGTTSRTLSSIAALNTGGGTFYADNAVGFKLLNGDATNALNYMFCSVLWQQ